MTADDNLNQRVQIAQDRTVETTHPETRTGERDPVPEPVRKKVRFSERVEAQTPEGAVVTSSRSTSSSSSSSNSSSSSSSSSSPTEIATSMHVDESDQDSSKRKKVTHGTDMELEGLVMESEIDRLQRYSDSDFLMQVKQDADAALDLIVFLRLQSERSSEEGFATGWCASICSCGRSVFNPKDCTFCPQMWSHSLISI